VIGGIGSAARAALDLVLPPQCLCCDAAVSRPGQFCADCFRLVSFVTDPMCGRCGVPFAAAGQGGPRTLCPSCEAEPPRFGQARAALRYDAQGRRLILPFKHADRPEVAAVLAPHMARAGAALLGRAEFLVPVPLHRARLFHRRGRRISPGGAGGDGIGHRVRCRTGRETGRRAGRCVRRRCGRRCVLYDLRLGCGGFGRLMPAVTAFGTADGAALGWEFRSIHRIARVARRTGENHARPVEISAENTSQGR